MERYKKKTILLCLASMLTVVGAFAAEHYSNTLMALKIDVGSGGYVNMTAFTKKPYTSPLKINKINDNSYIIKLDNTDSNASAPDIDNCDNIESIEISTYPYTKESDGFTKILIRTIGKPALNASQALFISDNSTGSQHNTDQEELAEDEEENNIEETTGAENSENSESSENFNKSENAEKSAENLAPVTTNNNEFYTPPDHKNKTSGTSEYMIAFLCISVLLMLIGFIFIFSKDRMASIVGNQENDDIDNKLNNKKQNKTKKLKSTINKLDKIYSNKTTSVNSTYNATGSEHNEYDDLNEQEEVQNNVVDLDVIFRELQQTADNPSDNENDDLADLLKVFTLETESEEIPKEEAFNEELFNDIINNNKLKFSDSDLEKINNLMQLEISTETTEDLKKYLSTPITKPQTKEQILADFISTCSINQNISLSEEDILAIEKIMNVELDADFTTNFATNPARTKIVEKEIQESAGRTVHRTSEIITLKVKNLLPDLSKELEKQQGKEIEHEAKPTVVYFSEGYEYDKLTVSEDLSVITDDVTQNIHKPSYEGPYTETGYTVSTLSIKDELPDLTDVMKNPQKYDNSKKVIKQEVDESSLLKSITNVTFKPFYEETVNEFEQFDNDIEQKSSDNSLTVPKSTNNKNNDINAEKLLKLIEAQQNKRAQKKQNPEESKAFKKELEASIKQKLKKNKLSETYNLNGESFKILKTIQCTKQGSCKLISANDKYIVIGNIANKEIILKEYSTLKEKEMYIRQKNKTDNTKYIVKIGMHKFIIRITEDNMEFVMDLC